MRWIICIACVLNVWPSWGQTFNMRYDLRENNRAQVSWDLEFTSNNAFMIIQGSDELDTIAPGLYFNFNGIGITRIENDGTKAWDKRFAYPFHGTFVGWANCCDSMPGGGVVIGGSKQDTLQNLAVFLMVFDAEGDTVFTRDLGIAGQQWNGFSLKRLQDGGFIIVGQTDATGYLDGFAIRTDPFGNELWRRTYGMPSPQTDVLFSVIQLNDGGFIMGGGQFPTNDTKQFWVQRTDNDGEVLWDTTWGPLLPGAGAHVEILQDGRVAMASNWSYPGGGSPRSFYMAELNTENGELIWEQQYGGIAQFQVLFAVKETPNGDLIACGVSEESGSMQGVLLRTTADGDSIWMRKYWYQDSIYTQGTGQFYDVLPTPDGGFIATGPTYRYQPVQPNFPPGYSQDAWVVKVDGMGCIVPGCNSVGIEEQATNLLDALSIYPNPAHGQVTMELTLPPSVAYLPLQLSLVGMDGRIARQRTLDGNGAHTLALDGLAAGVYYVHIASEGKWLTGGKLIVQ